MSINSHHHWLLAAVLILSFCGCSRKGECTDVLNQAECLIDEQPDSAFVLLRTIDGSALREGSELQARYALLYTKAQYKSYNDPTSDSLIDSAVDYYEAHGNDEDRFYSYLYQGIIGYLLNDYTSASVSLFRSMQNGTGVSDPYSKGQLYLHLANIMTLQRCAEATEYAHKAYEEYTAGNLFSKATNALMIEAISYLRVEDYSSCRQVLRQGIERARMTDDYRELCNFLSVEAQYAVMTDSLELAETIYKELSTLEDWECSDQDYENLAIIASKQHDAETALACLRKAEPLIASLNDTLHFWTNNLTVGLNLQNDSIIILSQNKLLHLGERALKEGVLNMRMSAQRDYIKWELNRSELANKNKNLLLSLSSLCLLLLLASFFYYHKSRQTEIKLQSEKILSLQIELKQKEQERNKGLECLRQHPIIAKLRQAVDNESGAVFKEWDLLNLLFTENLPYFETSVRKVVRLSDMEWKICMLLKLSFSSSDIAVLVNRSISAISTSRRRLFEKTFLKKGRASDWDNFIDSL